MISKLNINLEKIDIRNVGIDLYTTYKILLGRSEKFEIHEFFQFRFLPKIGVYNKNKIIE